MCVIVWSPEPPHHRNAGRVEPPAWPSGLVSVQPSPVCTIDPCQTNSDNSISSEDRLVALGKRQQDNDTIKITIRMKGGAMPKLECGRRRRPRAEVQA
jgi:hypothetical protein